MDNIDVLINRALVYGLLTASLAASYLAGVVRPSGACFRGLTGQESGLAVVVSTLIVAGLFVPLRRRVQGLIDRHFYRRKVPTPSGRYRLSARPPGTKSIYERLSGALVGAVSDTMPANTHFTVAAVSLSVVTIAVTIPGRSLARMVVR